jgi:hypothetical protein
LSGTGVVSGSPSPGVALAVVGGPPGPPHAANATTTTGGTSSERTTTASVLQRIDPKKDAVSPQLDRQA